MKSNNMVYGVSVAFVAVLMDCLFLSNGCNIIAQENEIDYPKTRKVEQVDSLHGIQVRDPYRWLEDFDSGEVKAWAQVQNDLTEAFVSASPMRTSIETRIAEIGRFDSVGTPTLRGGRLFVSNKRTDQKQSVVYVRDDKESELRIALDPDKVIQDKGLRFGGYSISPDGKLISFRVTKNQSQWGTTKVLQVDNGELFEDQVQGMRTNTTVWTKDSKGFFYARYGETQELEAGTAKPQAKIYYHLVGTDQAKDELVFDRPDKPDWVYGIWISDDGKYVLIAQGVPGNSNNRVFYKPVNMLKSQATELIGKFDSSFTFLGNEGTNWWFQTNQDATNGRVVNIDIKNPNSKHWVDLIPERSETLNSVKLIGDHFVASYLKDAREKLKVFDVRGKFVHDLELPDLGGRYGGYNGDRTTSITFVNVSGAADPGTVYRLNVATGEHMLYERPQLSFDPDSFETKQVFYASKDGTRIPMTIVHKKNLVLDGNHPALMYAFGSGGWSAYVWFQPHIVAWLEMGGIYVVPNIRGGGEYGTSWMNAGIKTNKQNAIDDYVWAAKWLITNKYTNPSLMVANGGSASGVLPAAAVVQQPHLFGAALIDIPFLDILRYHEFTVFSGWRNAFGVASNPGEFKAIFAYSPYHSIKSKTAYPAVLVSVGEYDKAAVPMHGFKFVAAMQAAQTSDNPVLLKVIKGAGHSYGTSNAQIRKTHADQLSFLARTLDFEQKPK